MSHLLGQLCDKRTKAALDPRIYAVLRKRGSARTNGFLRLSCDVPVVVEEVQNGLYLRHGLKRAAVPHRGASVELLQAPFLQHGEDAACLFEHRILRQHRVGGLRVVQKIPSEPNGVCYRSAVHRERFRHVQKLVAPICSRTAEKSCDTERIADQLACPVSKLGIIRYELWFDLLRKSDQQLFRIIRKRDRLRLFRVLVLQQIDDEPLVSVVDLVRHGFRPEASAADKGHGHTIEKTCGQASASEGRIIQHFGDHVRLRHQQNGQSGVHDALTLSADTVDADGIAGVALQHDVDVDVLRVDAGEGIEDAALAGDQRRSAVVGGDDRHQLLGCDIVHIELHREDLPELGDLLRDLLHFLHFDIALGDLVFNGFLPAFQNPFLHSAALHKRSIPLIVLKLILVDGLEHHVLNRRLSLGGRSDGEDVGVERLEPVLLSLNAVLALQTHREHGEGYGSRHIHRGLRALRHGGHIVRDILRQRLDREPRHRVSAERNGVFPADGTFRVVDLRGDVVGLACDPLVILGRATPDGLKFRVVERWDASFRLPIKTLSGFFRIPIAFHGAYCPPEHRGVPAAFPYLLIHVGEAVLVEEHGEVDDTGLHIDLGVGIAVEKPRGVLRLGVEVGIDFLHPFDQPLAGFRVGDPVNEEDNVVLGSRRFAVLRFHVVAARIEEHRHIGELFDDVLLRDPVLRIVGVGIIAVHHKGIGMLEVFFAAVVVFEADEGVVFRHQPLEGIQVRHRIAVGIDAVRPVAAALCYPYGE